MFFRGRGGTGRRRRGKPALLRVQKLLRGALAGGSGGGAGTATGSGAGPVGAGGGKARPGRPWSSRRILSFISTPTPGRGRGPGRGSSHRNHDDQEDGRQRTQDQPYGQYDPHNCIELTFLISRATLSHSNSLNSQPYLHLPVAPASHKGAVWTFWARAELSGLGRGGDLVEQPTSDSRCTAHGIRWATRGGAEENYESRPPMAPF